jgi:hypothetical protein
MARRQARRCLRVLGRRYQGRGIRPFSSNVGNLGTGRCRTAMYTDSIEQLRGTAVIRQVRVRAETGLPAECIQATVRALLTNRLTPASVR